MLPPIMLVAVHDVTLSRFDGPARVIALGFQLARGRLIGPRDMFDDPGLDADDCLCDAIADHLRCHGSFEPHRLPMDEMEYTTLPAMMDKRQERWEDLLV